MITVKRIEQKKDIKAFVQFAYDLYKDCPYYVPSLYADEINSVDPKINPMAKYCKQALYLAYDEKGKIVGRVAAIINSIANKNHNKAEVRYGWFDFVDNKEVSAALLAEVEKFGRENGMTVISGPLGFTDFDNEGMVVEGFDKISSFVLKYNYSYYREHMEALGYEKVIDWVEYRIYVPDHLPEKVEKLSSIIKERYDIHVKNITKKQVYKENYGQKIFDLINRTYCVLFDYTILPPEVIDSYIDTYLGLLDLNYVVLLENGKGDLVGLAITMPSIAKAAQKAKGKLFPFGWFHILKSMYIKHEEALELMLIAVDPEYRNKGLNAVLIGELFPRIIKGGFKYGESNAELETNQKVQNIWDDYEKDTQRIRRIYGKKL